MNFYQKTRILKFRIWDILKKELTYDKHPIFFYKNRISIRGFRMNAPEDSNFIIQQYIGLEDKNKKEIYEGDIMKVPSGEIGTIVYEEFESSIGFKLNISNMGWEGEDLEYIQASSVIGNIYENPELLNLVC